MPQAEENLRISVQKICAICGKPSTAGKNIISLILQDDRKH